MKNRKYYLIFLIPVILGFIHGYYISKYDNKVKTQKAYQMAHNNYRYDLANIDKILISKDIDAANSYLIKIRKEANDDYNSFLKENPSYLPKVEIDNEK